MTFYVDLSGSAGLKRRSLGPLEGRVLFVDTQPLYALLLQNRAALAETIRCGRPGTQMPGWLDGAYRVSPCYGLPMGPPPPGTDLTPVLSADEVEALVDFLTAKMVGK